MENDDILEDLLSWSGSPSQQRSQSTVSLSTPLPPQAPSSSLSVGLAPSAVSPNVMPSRSSSTTKPSTTTTITTAMTTTEGSTTLHIPSEVDSRLFPHQREGIQWLYRKHCRARACLLADEMGLGKTVQVAAFLGQLYRQKAIKTTIVVVPPTLLPMWERALAEWGEVKPPTLCTVHNDAKAKRRGLWRKLSFGIPCVLLTTYGVLRQDVKEMSATLVDYVVLDEAHLIKDASTHAFKSALQLSARHKVALTGTPLMNSFEDMWSIFRFLDGSILSVERADFSAVSATLLRGNERDATSQQRQEAESELAKLQAAIQPFMLRREKSALVGAVHSVKQDTVVWVTLSETQRQLYAAFLAQKEVTAAMAEDSTTNPLLLLTSLLQMCNHPWLNLTDEAFRAALLTPFVAPCAEVGDVLSGSKLSVALSLLSRSISEGRKTLVFSRSKRLLHMLACLLDDRQVSYCRIDGDCPSDERFQRARDFNDPASAVWVCLLTTQVGGVGLTFEAASCVVLLDPSWNPSADAQAVDRVHRIGQQRDVQVYRLVTCGTVEEKVYRNQVFKTMAAKQAMLPEEQRQQLFRYFTRLQLRSMFDVGDLDQSQTAVQLEQLHPGHVDPDLRHALRSFACVSDVSDNGSVLAERVASDAADDELVGDVEGDVWGVEYAELLSGGKEEDATTTAMAKKRDREVSEVRGESAGTTRRGGTPPPRLRNTSPCVDVTTKAAEVRERSPLADVEELLSGLEKDVQRASLAPTATPEPHQVDLKEEKEEGEEVSAPATLPEVPQHAPESSVTLCEPSLRTALNVATESPPQLPDLTTSLQEDCQPSHASLTPLLVADDVLPAEGVVVPTTETTTFAVTEATTVMTTTAFRKSVHEAEMRLSAGIESLRSDSFQECAEASDDDDDGMDVW